jgi:hypothetical protein
MVNKSIIGATCACLAVVSFNANAALSSRLGGLAYYDDVLEITWLADANAYGFRMNWATADAWAAGLDINGVTGWRLPDTNPVDGTTVDDANVSYIGTEDLGYNVSAPGTLYAGSTASEMSHLFYNTLGNLGYCDPGLSTVSRCSGPQSGWGLTNTGPFSNLQSNYYWSATEYAPNTSLAWFFYMGYGGQDGTSKAISSYAWAVHSGDVSAVPVPAAVWLFGSGLIGLIGVARRKSANI